MSAAPATNGSAAAPPATHTPGGTLIPLPVIAPPAAISRISNVSLTTFGMPSGVTLPKLDGSNWNDWSGILEAILTLYECEDVIDYDAAPTGVTADDWEAVQRRSKACLCLYTAQDVYSLVASDVNLPTFKHKWDVLKGTYSGQAGSTSVFNMWIC
jgi:hypothetical protein